MSGAARDIDGNLIRKYGYNAFMYIEYPHKRYWSEEFNDPDFRIALEELFAGDKNVPLLLYVHMPYCQKQCYFCTCHVEITKDYEMVKNYLNVLYREIDLFLSFFDQRSIRPNFREIHLGGGSPTYIYEEEFNELIEKLGSLVDISGLNEFSIEIDPRRVKRDRLKYYHEKGINRISFGVQDFDLDVQRAVNRVQPAKLTENLLTGEIRKCFKHGINFDIICGLPRQTRETMRRTMQKVVEMSPDRICLNYLDYAPKFAPHQLLMPKAEIPDVYERKVLFLEALEILLGNGYVRTGYDHFAKPTDDVARAMENRTMQWNSLGYTPGRCVDMIGIGVHSYSRVGPDYYSQNVYELESYEAAVARGEFPIYRGHKLNRDDVIRRDIIQQLRSYFRIRYQDVEKKYGIRFREYFKKEETVLEEFARDGIVELSDGGITITELGRQFANLACRSFDKYIRERVEISHGGGAQAQTIGCRPARCDE